MSNVIQQLFEVGQSIWCDNLSRAMIDQGGLKSLIDLGVVGVTSNPTIFMKAITGASDYDDLMSRLASEGKDTAGIYEGLVLPDIADAADMLRPVYDRTSGLDGYVSLEVNPQLAYDTDATVAEARRLHAALNRPNILIKVPATEAGIPAIATLIGEGINVNVTLIFSLAMYDKVMAAYVKGVGTMAANGGDLRSVASVASFFVSRVDGLVDKRLEALKGSGKPADHLMGKAAIANARLAYGRFLEVFGSSGAFAEYAAGGARVQRPLWASTSTKNPAYPDTLYCDTLVAPNTVNTLPPATIDAVLDHGVARTAIDADMASQQRVVDELASLGIDMAEVTNTLMKDGVQAFVDSFEELLGNISRKRDVLGVSK
ncbi:MAG: transaldolase [Planctomycetota bacterium]